MYVHIRTYLNLSDFFVSPSPPCACPCVYIEGVRRRTNNVFASRPPTWTRRVWLIGLASLAWAAAATHLVGPGGGLGGWGAGGPRSIFKTVGVLSRGLHSPPYVRTAGGRWRRHGTVQSTQYRVRSTEYRVQSTPLQQPQTSTSRGRSLERILYTSVHRTSRLLLGRPLDFPQRRLDCRRQTIHNPLKQAKSYTFARLDQWPSSALPWTTRNLHIGLPKSDFPLAQLCPTNS